MIMYQDREHERDTLLTCLERGNEIAQCYMYGAYKPHYPMPVKTDLKDNAISITVR